MTIAIALTGIDGMVLTTDSRECIHDESGNINFVEDEKKKLWQIDNSFGLMVVGSLALHTDWLIELFNREKKNRHMNTDFDSMVHEFANYVGDDLIKYMRSITENQLSMMDYRTSLILCGYDMTGQAKIAELATSNLEFPFMPRTISTSYHIAGIQTVGLYWIQKIGRHMNERQYKPRSLTVETLKNISIFIVNETSKYNRNVGGPIQMAIIRKDKDIEFLQEEKTESGIRELRKSLDNIAGEKLFSFLNI